MREYFAYLHRLYDAGALWFQRQRRDEPPFVVYLGKRGRGKSLFMTRTVQVELALGSYVLSNTPVYDPYSENVTHPWVDLKELFGLVADDVVANEARKNVGEAVRRIILVFDEAQNHFDARDWEKNPKWFRQFLAESRHHHIGVIAATQSFSSVDKRFRLLCDDIIRVRPLWDSMKHRLAFFRLTWVDDDPNSAEEEMRVLGRSKLVYVSARAYAGYSTALLPNDDDFGGADDKLIAEKVQAMREAVNSRHESAA